MSERLELTDGWELARTEAGACSEPSELAGAEWRAAQVPGTVAGALGDDAAGLDLDAFDWWFRTRFAAPPAGPDEELWLRLQGVATLTEVFLNGRRVRESDSMFRAFDVAVPEAGELVICCRALRPGLEARRRPRARWRTALVADGNLRFFRTMLIGRAPGFAPGPPVVGPFRPVALERRRGVQASEVRLRTAVEGGSGRVSARATLRALGEGATVDSVTLRLSGRGGEVVGELSPVSGGEGGGVVVEGELTVQQPELWWPHTHGTPALYGAELRVGNEVVPLGRVGFRDLGSAADLERDGLALSINGVPVFARGALWTPLDRIEPHAPRERLRAALQQVVRAGMNMLRVPGIGCYESDDFYDLCDELGILVWQDFMFANLDYPEQDEAFMASVQAEATELLGRLAHRPGLAVLCGGSEVAQQVAMLGLDPALAEGPLYAELLPRLVAQAGVQAPYVPSTPWGGDLPFRTDAGVANYYGVGAYLRPLSDARAAEVRFAGECLAFSNVPDETALEQAGGLGVAHPAWKRGIPRDVGSGWDFEDVRDHYLRLLYGADPVGLRSFEGERYLELTRQVTGEVMAETFGEWRRQGSPCQGALVLWLKDLLPGAGWGLLDSTGEPKAALSVLARALAPVAVWSTDEGLGGIAAHVANDGPEPLEATLRVACYREFETLVAQETAELSLGAHSGWSGNVESVLGRFVDASYAYHFGPPAQDAIVLSLEDGTGGALSQAFRFPAGRPLAVESAAGLGLTAELVQADGGFEVVIQSRRLVYGARVAVAGHLPADDAFSVEPGRPRRLALAPRAEAQAPPAAGTLTALNLAGRMRLTGVG